MHNADLDAARDHIAGRVDAPMFDDLVARGARLRRFRLGVTAAAITVLVGGAVVGVGQPWLTSEGVGPTQPDPVAELRPTAEQIVDDPASHLTDFFMSEQGITYSFWTDDCKEPPCAVALAISSDGWRTRTTQLLPREADWGLHSDAVLIVPPNNVPYLVDAAGQRTNVIASSGTLASAENAILHSDSASGTWSVIDPESGRGIRVPEPPGVAVRQMHLSPEGDLTALGLSGDEMVLAQSTDTGDNWSRQPVPPSNNGTSYLLRAGPRIVIVEMVATGSRLLVSSDSGATWDVSEHPPFGHVGCAAATAGPLLVVTLGELWTSTDDAWLRFARVQGAPALECIISDGRTMTGMGPDKATAYVSHDFGTTWQRTRVR